RSVVHFPHGRQSSRAPSGVAEEDAREDVPRLRHGLPGIREAGVRHQALRQPRELRTARREATRREARAVSAQGAGGGTGMTTTADTTPAKRKAKKRPDGDGSIRYSEAKKLWIGRVMVGYRPDGKPDIREVAAKQQAECKQKFDALKGKMREGTLGDVKAGRE